MDQLLKTLNELSEKSDIRIVKFTPKKEVARNFYAEIPVQMEIEGNYHEIATFFDKVSKEDRIINISNIGMKKPEMKSGKVVLQAGCLAKTFRAIEERKPGQTQAP
jgi:type IV pilus assembly protein PilO